MIRALSLAGIAGALAGLLVQLPLSWFGQSALERLDAGAQALGTVWRGQLAYLDGLPTIATRLAGLGVAFEGADPTLELSGAARPGALDDLNLRFPVARLARFEPRLTGLDGHVVLALDRLGFGEAGCTAAEGDASTDLLAANSAIWSWQGPQMSGPVTCEEGALIVEMDGREGTDDAVARIALRPGGLIQAELTIRTSQPGAAVAMPLIGFDPAGQDTYRLVSEGQWR